MDGTDSAKTCDECEDQFDCSEILETDQGDFCFDCWNKVVSGFGDDK